MDLALALRVLVGVGHLALGGAVAARWRAGGGPALALLLALRGLAGLAGAGSHAVASPAAAQALFLLAAALSLALVVAAFGFAVGARRGRWALAGSVATFLVALAALALHPRLYGELGDAGVASEGPLAALQALVWVAYAGAIARLAREQERGDARARLATRLVLAGFAVDVAWVATGAARALLLDAPPRLLDHAIVAPTGAARVGLVLQLAGALGLVAGAWAVLSSAARGRSPWWVGGVLVGALAGAALLRLAVPAGAPLLVLDAAWRLLLPALVAYALLRLGAGRDAVSEEGEADVEVA